MPAPGHVAVTVTPAARDAMRGLAVAATTAAQTRVNMSDAVIAALVVVRQHPDEYRAALAAGEDSDS